MSELEYQAKLIWTSTHDCPKAGTEGEASQRKSQTLAPPLSARRRSDVGAGPTGVRGRCSLFARVAGGRSSGRPFMHRARAIGAKLK